MTQKHKYFLEGGGLPRWYEMSIASPGKMSLDPGLDKLTIKDMNDQK